MDVLSIMYFTVLYFLLKNNGSVAYKCFKKELLQNMTATTKLKGTPFLIFDTEILTCCKYCKLHSLCKSVNFNRVSVQCQLMSERPTQFNTIVDFNNILIDMENWSESFLGACKNHNCPNNTVCRELKDSYNCQVIGCTGSPGVNNTNSSSFEAKALWGFNEMVEYTCERGYFPSINPICNENGMWSEFVCTPYSRCGQIRKCNESMEDKDYWLFDAVYQTLVKVFCKWGSAGFISLQHPNLASFSEFKMTGKNCSTIPIENHQNMETGTTEFQKIRLKKNQGFKINFSIYFYSTSSLNPQPYGTAKDCYPKDNGCGVLGKFVIDTRGTGFKFPDSLTWKTVGTSAVIENITMGGHVITGFCGGNCGGCEIDETGNGTHLEVDGNDMPPFESAELPICPFRV